MIFHTFTGIYYDTAEILPRVKPGSYLQANGKTVERVAPQFEARALLEGQAVARRAHAEDMGFKLGNNYYCFNILCLCEMCFIS